MSVHDLDSKTTVNLLYGHIGKPGHQSKHCQTHKHHLHKMFMGSIGFSLFLFVYMHD